MGLGFFEIVVLGVTLALDASIIAFSYGLCKPWQLKQGFKLAAVFAFFHWIMPILGWLMMYVANGELNEYADILDHWIAFFIFVFLGGKIIADALWGDDKEKEEDSAPLSTKILLMIGLGTSIDALAAGVMIFAQVIPLWEASFLIGAIIFVLVFISYCASRFCQALPTKVLEVTAGVVLIALGFKVLIEHIYA